MMTRSIVSEVRVLWLVKVLLVLITYHLSLITSPAQDDGQVVINGSLIDWYHQVPDSTGSMVWSQYPAGGESWTDQYGVEHSTFSNRGLLAMTVHPDTPIPLSPVFRVRNSLLQGTFGGIYKGGNEYYTFNGHEVEMIKWEGDSSYVDTELEIDVLHWTWDSVNADGTYAGVRYDVVGKIDYQPTDLAYYPEDDIVYGVFKTGTGGYRLGTIDLTTLQVNFISTDEMQEGRELRTLACNSVGELFGTDKNGYIYSVRTTDGRLTRIGSMGFKTQSDMMSATIDYRTDKMYWLGFLNNGLKTTPNADGSYTRSIAEGGRDTGLYEIDTKTGTAKLVGKTNFLNIVYEYDEDGQVDGAHADKYGKMQLTGIYVDGSIVRKNYDLKVTMKKSPLQMSVGQESYGNVVVTVKNRGLKTMPRNAYALALYADDQMVAYLDSEGANYATKDITPFASEEYYFSYNKPKTAGDKTLRVSVICTIDEKQDNNSVSASVRVTSIDQLPVPEISGTIENGMVYLTWRDPRGCMVEGAEDFLPFSYDGMGAWKLYDGDGGYTQSYNNIDFPNWNTPKAFIVMNPKEAGLDKLRGGQKFMPHSGNNYFAAWWTSATANGTYRVPNNDWFISPELSNMPHSISFWAKGIDGTEQLQVLATTKEYKSATDMDADNWTVLVETFQVSSEWKEYKIAMPQDHKHFALRCCSQRGSGLFLDDIAYETPLKDITGYRVYRNGQLVSVLSSNSTSFTDYNPPKDPHYYITALYDEGGESKPSNVFPTVTEPDPIPEENPADVNGDGAVDVSDVGLVIDYMASGFYDKYADVNGDGIIDVADIAEIIDAMARN